MRWAGRLPAPLTTVALYLLAVSTIGRGDGRSAVAAAAYRSGQTLEDLRLRKRFRYPRRPGEIVATRLIGWDGNRASLWNAAEAAERRKDARVAREVLVNLPHELPPRRRVALAGEFAAYLCKRYSTAADVAVHLPSEHGDNRNHHAHILLPTRSVEAGERVTAKIRALDNPAASSAEVETIRQEWARLVNAALADGGRPERVRHESASRRGLAGGGEHLPRWEYERARSGRAPEVWRALRSSRAKRRAAEASRPRAQPQGSDARQPDAQPSR